MNKLFTRIMASVAGFAMAIGAGVSVANNKEAIGLNAADSTTTMTWGGTTTQWSFDGGGDTYLEWTHNSTSTSPIVADDYRMYSGADITVKAKSAYSSSIQIKSLEITGYNSNSKNSNYLYYNASTGAKVTSSGTGVTALEWTKSETSTSGYSKTANFNDGLNSVTIARATSGNQVRVKSIVVTYEYTSMATVEATSMSISPAGPINAVVGQTVTFTPTLDGGSGNYEKTIEWTSTDESVAAKPEDSEDGEAVEVTVLAAGSTTITGTVATQNGASSSIIINAKALSGIAVTTAPTNTTYEEGDSFDPTGMVVTATYTDASTENVTSSCTFTPDPLTEGTTAVTISFGNKTTTQAVTVNPVSEVTFVYGTDNSDQLTMSKRGITMTVSDGTWDTNSNNSYKVFKGKTLQIESASRHFDKIELTCTANGSAQYGPGAFGSGAPSGYTFEANGKKGTWTGDATSVTFTATDNQVRMTQIYIRYKSTLPSVELDKTSVNLVTVQTSGVTVEATVNNVDTPSYSWTSNNGNVDLDGEDTNIVTIIPVAAGQSTVTLTVGGVTPALTATVTVSITAPLTVAEAIEHIDAVYQNDNESNGNDGNSHYVTGIISRFYSNSVTNNGQISYYISDDGTSSGAELEAYYGKGLNGANFTSIDDIQIGDTVVIYGTLKKYNSTYEFEANNYIVSLTPAPRVNSITLTPAAVTVEPNAIGDVTDLFTNITINQDQGSNKVLSDITWSSDNNDIFLIDDGQYLACNQHRSSTTIKASIGGRVYGSATVTIIDSNIYSISYDAAEEWVLVSDPSTLVAGDRVILTGVKDEDTYAAGTYSTGNNVQADTAHALTVNGNKVTGVLSTMIYTLEEGSVDDSLAFKDSAGKYLYAAGGTNSNHLKAQDTIVDNGSFILNSDGTVVAQGESTHNYMRYNNTGENNLFSCYGSSSTTGDLVTFYKHIGGAGVVDVPSLSMVATISARESTSNDVTTVTSPSLRFGASISVENWNAINANCPITDYGVMCLKRTTLNSYQGIDTVKEAYEAGRNVTNLHKCSNDREFAVPYENNGNYVFTVRIDVNDPAYYTTSIVAAPYILAGGQYYFLGEMEYSIKTLAEHYLADNTLQIALSNSALRVLAGQ